MQGGGKCERGDICWDGKVPSFLLNFYLFK